MQISSEFKSDFFLETTSLFTIIAPHKSCEKPAICRAASDEKPTTVHVFYMFINSLGQT